MMALTLIAIATALIATSLMVSPSYGSTLVPVLQ
jgi:hypothetical protein